MDVSRPVLLALRRKHGSVDNVQRWVNKGSDNLKEC